MKNLLTVLFLLLSFSVFACEGKDGEMCDRKHGKHHKDGKHCKCDKKDMKQCKEGDKKHCDRKKKSCCEESKEAEAKESKGENQSKETKEEVKATPSTEAAPVDHSSHH